MQLSQYVQLEFSSATLRVNFGPPEMLKDTSEAFLCQ